MCSSISNDRQITVIQNYILVCIFIQILLCERIRSNVYFALWSFISWVPGAPLSVYLDSVSSAESSDMLSSVYIKVSFSS